jgi:hypothetical protein
MMAGLSPLDVVSEYQDAWTRRDFDAAAKFIADDVVFDTPQQHLSTAARFLPMITAFAQRVEPRWELINATPATDSILLLYRLFTTNGEAAICADFFTIKDEKITAEILTFDPAPFQ